MEVITIMEAEVDEDNWQLLKNLYDEETKDMTDNIKQTFLIQSQSNQKNWRIVTHWRSQADLDQMRATEDLPVAVRIFKNVGAKPQLEIWNSVVHLTGR